MENISRLQEPKLVYEDAKLFDSILKDVRHLSPYIQKVRQDWEKAKLGPFDDKAYKTLVSHGGISSIRSQAITKATDQYEALGLHSETIKNEVLADAAKQLQALEQSLGSLKSASRFGTYNFPLDIIGIDESGAVQITDESKEAIKDKYCRVYLHTTQEIALYEKLQKVAEAVNDVWTELMDHNVSTSDLPFHYSYSRQVALLLHTLRLNEKGEELTVSSGMVPHLVSKYRAG